MRTLLRSFLSWDLGLALAADAARPATDAAMRWLVASVLLGMATRHRPLPALLGVLALAAALHTGGEILYRVSAYWQVRARRRFSRTVTLRLLRWVDTIPMARLEDPAHHDLLARADGELAGELFGVVRSATAALAAVTGLVAFGALVARTAPILLGCVAAATMATLWVETRFGLARYFLTSELTEGQRRAAQCHALFFDPAAAREMRIFGSADFLCRAWRGFVDTAYRERRRLLTRHTSVHALQVADVALTAAAVFVGLRHLRAGTVALPQVALLIAALGPLTRHAFTVAFESASIATAWPLLRQVSALMADVPPPSPSPPPPSHGAVAEARDLVFTYPGATEPALRGVTLRIAAGERVALVGANGSGKTTLAMVLLGLYPPAGGTAAIAPASPGVVLQRFTRYRLTAAANVALGAAGRRRVQPTELERAAEAAGLSAVIRGLPGGWTTRLDEGTDLSGGQWQRVALARALIGGRGLWVFDEPAAALDPLAEVGLAKTLERTVGDDALLVISHRLGITRLVDRVVVLDGGRIVQQGPPSRLATVPGPYRDMYEAQSAWYR